ncbi:5-oxoprolinase subunit C family protein [Pleomorphovibrio marinus]|uniref:5-oxoprolinase subunit C family protein n=1 Tax=Pleomorphovibrio marinus TaxID=2164132 RepID=UPI000E0AA85D|nr:biotin-dependent carboxyltransferase family protein [Pleomorphovibrio marinus]
MSVSKGWIKMIKPGPYTSIQDGGRWEGIEKGVPSGGCMDMLAARLANALLGQKEEKPCLEIFMGGVSFSLEKGRCQVAFCGADAEIRINGEAVVLGKIIDLQEGDQIEIMPFSAGQWLYMSLAGNFLVPKVLGSHSFYFPITKKARLEKGDLVPLEGGETLPPTNSYLGNYSIPFRDKVRVYLGPDFSKLKKEQQEELLNRVYTVSKRQNRMGIMLEEVIENDLLDPLSSPVFPGTIQLTPSGNLIVMMRDAQVTGGYPRVLEVEERDIGKLAQKRPGEQFAFVSDFVDF